VFLVDECRVKAACRFSSRWTKRRDSGPSPLNEQWRYGTTKVDQACDMLNEGVAAVSHEDCRETDDFPKDLLVQNGRSEIGEHGLD
jgi:hypothetical protein